MSRCNRTVAVTARFTAHALISAARQLARGRRSVVVVDAGQRRNRFASDGFISQDGSDPATIAATARAPLVVYPTVTWLEDTAIAARAVDGGFAIALGSGGEVHGKRVVLAVGVTDELPEIPGGDVAIPAGSVALAVGDGARAGISVHQSLVFR